jgi:hypothetical protein
LANDFPTGTEAPVAGVHIPPEKFAETMTFLNSSATDAEKAAYLKKLAEKPNK